MTPRLDEQLSRYGEYLDSLLVEVEPDQAIDRLASPGRRPRGEKRPVPTWRRGLVVAFGTAAAVLALVAAVLLVANPFGGADPAPPAIEPTPGDLEPIELVPTGAHLLTRPFSYQFAARDTSGVIWMGGYEGQLARLDPVSGESRVWTMRDDATFGPGLQGLAAARKGGVWMLLGDNSLRWFDGERFGSAVEAPAMVSDRDDLGSVVEAADGTLLATTAQGGLFRWDGSSWRGIDDARPETGAGALAIDSGGVLWVGNNDAGGMSRLQDEVWTTYSSDDAVVLAGPVRTIEPLAGGTVWIGTESGVARFDGATWSSWTSAEIGLRGDIAVTVAPDGAVWAAAGNETNGAIAVASFDGDGWFVYGPEHGLPATTPLTTAVPVATEEGVLVATGAGVYQLNDDRWSRVLPLEDAAAPAEPPALLAGVRGIQAAGGLLWSWGEDEIWRYAEAGWEFYAQAPVAVWDLAFDGVTLWAVNEALFYLDGDEWLRLAAAPSQVWRIDADLNTGVKWLSTGQELHRWDGETMTNVGYALQPDEDGYGYVGDITVTADGRVWAAGLYGYVPSLGGLAVYDDGSGLWETIGLGQNNEAIPAWELATTPQGDLWVMLSEWPDDALGTTWALARRDGATGEWTIYDEDLPDGQPLAMAATNDAVWLAQGGGTVEGAPPIRGIYRFDGETWSHRSADEEVIGLAAAPNGAVWYITADGVLHQVEA